MTAPPDRLAQFLAALDQLPPYVGPTFRGCVEDAQFTRPGQLVVAQGLVPTSRDVDVATEGRAVHRLYAISSRSGRDISAFSARRADQEVVFVPGTVFLLESTVSIGEFQVHLVSEILPAAEPVRMSDPELARFASEVEQLLASHPAGAAGPFDGVRGKFSGDLG